MDPSAYQIKALPLDDKIYVVINYGGFVKNSSLAIDIPLVNVHMKTLEDGILSKNTVIIPVGLPELCVVRIGSVWQNQYKIKDYYRLQKNTKTIKLIFDLEKQKPECVYYEKHTIDKKIKLKEINLTLANKSFQNSKNIYGSTMVKFKSENGIEYIVPGIELLMSSYVPRNKLIRNDIVQKPINEVIDKYINNYYCKENTYVINIDKQLELETEYFLAYMSCNEKSKSIISKIWSSLESGTGEDRHPYILPYHPGKISFKATGIWLNDKIFFIQRMDGVKPPIEIKVIGEHLQKKSVTFKKSGPNKNNTQKTTPVNQNEIEESLGITHEHSPSKTTGVKHIVSEVKPDLEGLNYESIDLTEEDNESVEKKSYIKTSLVTSASSGKTSESNMSKNIARTKYIIDKNPKKIESLAEISESLFTLENNSTIKNLYFIDDYGNEYKELIYANFGSKHINLNNNGNWAYINKEKQSFRKLLIAKFTISKSNKTIYILEIMKKNKSDSFYGVLFQINNSLSYEIIEKIKSQIASNKGHFRGKNIISFPIENHNLYRHKWGSMLDRFKSIFQKLEKY